MATSAPTPATSGASAKRVPDFFIVGAPKSGTTSLHQMLKRHPQIYMPELKEPQFLASDMRPRAGVRAGPREHRSPQTLDDYLALFANAMPEQRVGEASTFYLWSRTAAGSIAALQPDARIVAILREPASFLRSLHLMFIQWRVETERDLRTAIALEQQRREGRRVPRSSHRPQVLQYSEHVHYVEQLRRYQDRFGREQVLVLIYDDYRDDNEGTVRRVLRFLDVDDRTPIDLTNVNVTTRTVRSHKAKDLLQSTLTARGPLARAAKASVRALTTRQQRRGALSALYGRLIVAEPPPPDARLMLELRRRFKGEVEALSEYLDRDLVSLWGYDALD